MLLTHILQKYNTLRRKVQFLLLRNFKVQRRSLFSLEVFIIAMISRKKCMIQTSFSSLLTHILQKYNILRHSILVPILHLKNEDESTEDTFDWHLTIWK